MNDSIKLVLTTLAAAILVFVGGEALGVDWITVQATILYFIKTIGILFLLFSGGIATLEIAKYFRHKNHELEQLSAHESPTDILNEVPTLSNIVTKAVADALAADNEDQRRRHSKPHRLLDLEDAARQEGENTERNLGPAGVRET